jgi:hypothetical protein
LLAGCGWFSSSTPSKQAQACPSAVILRPLRETALFGPERQRRPENVAFYGVLSEVDSKCDLGADSVKIKLDVIVIGERGPAAGKADGVDLTYFVAATGPDEAVLSKKSFTVHIAFEPNQRRTGITDHIEETIALGGRRASDLSVNLGFQQSAEVVDFYKHFRGR